MVITNSSKKAIHTRHFMLLVEFCVLARKRGLSWKASSQIMIWTSPPRQAMLFDSQVIKPKILNEDFLNLIFSCRFYHHLYHGMYDFRCGDCRVGIGIICFLAWTPFSPLLRFLMKKTLFHHFGRRIGAISIHSDIRRSLMNNTVSIFSCNAVCSS